MKPFMIFLFLSPVWLIAQAHGEGEIPQLENPMSVEYLKKNLEKKSPRLVLNRSIEKELKQKLKTDPVLQNVYKAIQLNADEIRKQPLLERIQIGRRLLSVSREMLYRMNMLGMVYRIDGDKAVLDRINEELIAVCNFSDWNPSHYLDVAEMSMAVAIGLDWTAGKLPKSTIALAKNALVEKGIKPSYNKKGNTGWVNGTNNWNQVCHGGMIAAAITVAEDEPELAAETIHRALEGMPHALVEYGPDGVYPEGSTYWGYGTSFSVVTAAMFESAFGTDFGLGDYPSFKESAVFRELCNAPSGWYFNFADCGDKRSENGDFTLAWFASKTGNPAYFEKERFLRPAADMGKLGRTAGAALVWLSQYESKAGEKMPTAWQGGGANPIVIFTGEENDPHQYYFGGKGGRGMVNHGNMDGGSFIFELNGVRWVVDPGNQSYHELEKTGFNLWGRCQDCERWTLLTKNNYGHSTLTINNELHRTEGLATITDFKDGNKPEATVEMSATLGDVVKSAERRFVKDSPTSILIEDRIVTNDATKMVSWQLMTTADVEITKGGAVLKQDGKQLKLENLSHPELTVSVISLDPAPLELDRQIEGLKRIELRLPAYLIEDGEGLIRVRLSGM
ncbi:heparinase II/III domain-containing protein [Flavilitoribacter nigricans]|uniref:heparinase II/III domain-containing protein n=1 Tax=Flavilitoribacter nigricans TaxID=70997 RepID=UPI001F35D373|nr:heparinase II/III family protein [Flavilitoribacter nigricans]